MRACWLKWVGRDWSISADYIWLNYSGANIGFSAEEIAERTEELRNPEARKPRAAAPAPTQAGNGKSNFAGKPSPAGKSKKKKFYASKPKGK